MVQTPNFKYTNIQLFLIMFVLQIVLQIWDVQRITISEWFQHVCKKLAHSWWLRPQAICAANASTVRNFSMNNFNYANPSLVTKPVGLHLYKGKGTLVNYHCFIHASRPSQCCQLSKVRSQKGANYKSVPTEKTAANFSMYLQGMGE